jgi:hypothetical protein
MSTCIRRLLLLAAAAVPAAFAGASSDAADRPSAGVFRITDRSTPIVQPISYNVFDQSVQPAHSVYGRPLITQISGDCNAGAAGTCNACGDGNPCDVCEFGGKRCGKRCKGCKRCKLFGGCKCGPGCQCGLHGGLHGGKGFCPCGHGCRCKGGCRGLDRDLGFYRIAYPVNPGYYDQRDTRIYAAQGWGVPMAMPLAPNVEHTYNHGWGVPSSRLTRVSRTVGPVPFNGGR